MSGDPRVLAEIRGGMDAWQNLLDTMRRRVGDLGVAFNTIDLIAFDGAAGDAKGYTQKLLGGVPVKGLGPLTLGPLLFALGLKLVVAEDPETIAKIRDRWARRKYKNWYASGGMPTRRRRRKSAFKGCTEWGKVMAARRILLQSESERREPARKAARARWAKRRTPAETPT